ncbi:MAG: HD-GYP domain-containing protein [Anaerolineaceae bacterium]|nr:HD-GYP domain-containing protein [Anaerolineaceae bacterium]
MLYAFSIFDQGVLPDILYPSLSLGISYVVAIAIDNVSLFRNLKQKHMELIQTYDTTLQGWARALELRDYETKGHTIRVTNMTVELARSMGINEDKLIHIRRGAILHDIGKIGIPDHILLKPGKLTEDEWKIMRQHPRLGYEMLLPISFLKPALDIVIYHHERWDGNGYPKGLKGKDIPLAARIFSVVDVWDALTSDRPYHDALPKEEVLNIIQKESGTHFDPIVVAVFMKYINKKHNPQMQT